MKTIIPEEIIQRVLTIVETENLFDTISNEDVYNYVVRKAFQQSNDFAVKLIEQKDEKVVIATKNLMKKVYINAIIHA